MEPSTADEWYAEEWSLTDEATFALMRAMRGSRNEGSYLPLNVIAEIIAENLETGEHMLLAEILIAYAEEHFDA